MTPEEKEFAKFDTDGDGKVTEKDAVQMATNILTAQAKAEGKPLSKGDLEAAITFMKSEFK